MYSSCLIILLVSMVSLSYGQWYVFKKDYTSNLMNYPNPGKRSDSDSNLIDCSKSYSQLESDDEKYIWYLTCVRQRNPLSFLHSNEDESDFDSISFEKRRVASDFPRYFDDDLLVDPFLQEIRHVLHKNKGK